ncbi:ABC transporter permease [Nguyenibacter sp. L1]|uniref:ABC transporter permease n=1 Tax=Nguyenibacter sp. L1 TaxID=3049350 RepID=UPI002B46EE9D|nr:ABC transporter permease [Nguyenibacter sp. L1]WRH89760.1 ABC transporter permease [Nguyenibacter sp. L1]
MSDITVSHGVWRRRMAGRGGVIALLYVGSIIFACFCGPFLLPFGPTSIDLHHRFLPPLAHGHVLGTDEIGRDLLARVLRGGRVSLVVGVVSTVFSSLIGTVVGIVAGYRPGGTRFLITTIIDTVLCFPVIFLLLTLAAILHPGLVTIVGIVTLVSWMEVARVAQAQTVLIRQMDYVTAVMAMGAPDRQILFREILPNVAPAIIVNATLNIARAILLESYVSYLGYGIQPPGASWGNLLNNAQEYLESDPWLAVIPGFVIALTVMMFNILGAALRDAIAPGRRA